MREQHGISIEVVEGDALAMGADVLVLKYAQALYGADRNAVLAAGIDPAALPREGGFHVVSRPTGVAATTLLFVGVSPLRDFDYAGIRRFGQRALSAVASECPGARIVALTIHGAGYGLDEMEAFDSELAGVLDAVGDGDTPRALERILFVEVNPGRADRMKARLARHLAPHTAVTRGAPVADAVHAPSADRLQRVGYDSAQREHAFVAMPFAEEFDDLFHYGITSAVHAAGLLCERVDQQAYTGDVVDRVKSQIETARIVIADLTDSNPNVYLEVGFAWGRNVPTVLMTRKDSEPKFDVRGQKCLKYSKIHEAETLLTAELRGLARVKLSQRD